MAKFIEGFADKMIVPVDARDAQAFDDELPGFGIRKFGSGKASYFVKFNVGRQQRRKTLGKVVRGNLKAMRLEASTVLAKARLGTDVVAQARAAAAKSTATLGDVVPRYLSARSGELRASSHTEVTRYLMKAWQPLHSHAIDAITRQTVIGVVDDLARDSGKVTADRARIALSGCFSWAIDRGYLENNPAINIRASARTTARSRVLTESELVEVWNACLNDDHGRIVRLLILTGQRRAEIGDLCWSEIKREKRQIELPERRTKNSRAHVVPLSDEALAILEGIAETDGRDLVFGLGARGFSGWSKAKNELNERIAEARRKTGVKKAMPGWTIHDLRRSFVTHVSERGFAPPHVVEAIVNHISGAKAGVAGVYNRATYLLEKRQALERWGSGGALFKLAELIDPAFPRLPRIEINRGKKRASRDEFHHGQVKQRFVESTSKARSINQTKDEAMTEFQIEKSTIEKRTGIGKEDALSHSAAFQNNQVEFDRVRNLRETAAIIGLSLDTLRRLIRGGKGPRVTRLSARRIGIRDSHREAWLAAQASTDD